MENLPVLTAFGLTFLAGLSTGIGSALAFFTRRTNTRFLAAALGFSAGVMIYVSFVEILALSMNSLTTELGNGPGMWTAIGSFFGGIAFIALIDRLVPSFENPHEMRRVEELTTPEPRADYTRLHRMGLFTALAIAIHNFPEGLVTFTAAISDPALGLTIAVAVAIHNIPEGIAGMAVMAVSLLMFM